MEKFSYLDTADFAATVCDRDNTEASGKPVCEHNPSVSCPCAKECPRHGKCCLCVAHHREHGKLPACLREKKN